MAATSLCRAACCAGGQKVHEEPRRTAGRARATSQTSKSAFLKGSLDLHQSGSVFEAPSPVASRAEVSGRRVRASVSMSLPHVGWTARAIKSFGMAELEARKLKYPTTGTESLLMGMLTEGTSLAARFLRSKGVSLLDLRDETVKLLGKADMYYFSPEHPPLTPPAEAALKWAVEQHQKEGGKGEISTELILLGIWEQKESGAGHRLLSNCGIKDEDMGELKKLMAEPVPA